MRRIYLVLMLLAIVAGQVGGQNLKMYQYKQDDAQFLFFDKNLSQYIPHMVRNYEHSKAVHEKIWVSDSLYVPERPMMYVTDWEDAGNGGASVIPYTTVQIGMAPLDFSFFVAPSVERYRHLFDHEYTHVVMMDKYTQADLGWRKFLGMKVAPSSTVPITTLWSYLTTPRWYAPRWYQEGISCFMETWLGGGQGRALGGYDEMYFRSIIDSGNKLYSVVGLETEGTTQDFQLGTNSYLYGTRFVNYLVYQYGYDKLIAFYNRTADSHRYFINQFKAVYGRPLRDVWEEWIQFENEHQKENLETIGEYPLTEVKPIVDEPLGSVSPLVYDKEANCFYAAMNYPGKIAHLEKIDAATGKHTVLCTLEGVQLYQVSYVAFDPNRRRIFFTSQNNKFRGIRVYDLEKGRITEKLNFQRMSNLVYDPVKDRLYGLFVNAGVEHLAYYDADLKERTILYSFPFGESVFDLDVSHDGNYITASRSGLNGEQSLIRFSVHGLETADLKYDTLLTLEDSNLGQFRFSQDDSSLIGNSYYTGVSNIWKYNFKDSSFDLMSNTKTGLFAPLEMESGELAALEFHRDGMQPVLVPQKKIEDANAIEFLGQKAYAKNPQLEHIGDLNEDFVVKDFKEVYDKIEEYNPFKEMKMIGAYPDISGFRDRKAFNQVTPVIGYRFLFQDPIGLNSLSLSVGTSPWSSNDWKNKFHFEAKWHYYFWSAEAAWNQTDFYDLFGPFRTSREGYKFRVAYDYSNTMLSPATFAWGASAAAYGMMDALPLYQEIDVKVKNMQTFDVYVQRNNTRTSLGGVMPESGYRLYADAYSYLASGKLYPSLSAGADVGFLVPIMRNTSFWLRTAAGQYFGDKDSVFGNTYFGGFRNNIIDYRDPYRFRSESAMPGVEIDAIKAHSFAKATAELNLKPFRFNNFGAMPIYPTYAQLTIFSSDLLTSEGTFSKMTNYVNIGAQLNLEVVLMNFFKTTWSVGYAKMLSPAGCGLPSGQWMVSLKLL